MEILKNQEYDELINRYISGEMNESEKSAFLTSLNKDEKLRHRAELVGLIAKEIQENSREDKIKSAIEQTTEDNFAERVFMLRRKKHIDDSNSAACSCPSACSYDSWGENETTEEATIEEKKTKRIPKRWWYSIAAGILVIIGFFTLYPRFSRPDLMAIADSQDIQMITYSRGDEDSVMVARLNSSFEIIKSGDDVRNAISRLTAVLSNANDNPTIYNHKPEIIWNLAIAYMKIEDKENAIKFLKEVVSNSKGTPFAEKAQKLIDEIE